MVTHSPIVLELSVEGERAMPMNGFRAGTRRPKQKDRFQKAGRVSTKRRRQSKDRLMAMRLAGYRV